MATTRSHTKVALQSLAAAVFMFGFGYAMVPIYDIICDITGLNGNHVPVSKLQTVVRDTSRHTGKADEVHWEEQDVDEHG